MIETLPTWRRNHWMNFATLVSASAASALKSMAIISTIRGKTKRAKMTTEEFESIWIAQIATEKAMLIERAAAYATHGDRLGNFYEGAALNDCHPLSYAFSLVSKHIIALRDLIAKIEAGNGTGDEKESAKIEEYITDIRNYAVLIKAIYLGELAAKITEGQLTRKEQV
jgi:predicted chitinase